MQARKIYFIPGIMGSTLLRRPDKSVVWSFDLPTLTHALVRDPRSLEGDLIPGEVIEYARCLGLQKSVYSNILRFLYDEFGRPSVKPFPYDWRLPIQESAELLADDVDRERRTAESIQIVGHSMGGVVAALAVDRLNRGRAGRAVDRVIALGTPFRGSAKAFKTLQTGEPDIIWVLKWWLDVQRVRHPLSRPQLRDVLKRVTTIFQMMPPKDELTLFRAGETLGAFDDNLWSSNDRHHLENAQISHQILSQATLPQLSTLYSYSSRTDSEYELDTDFRIIKPSKTDLGDGTVCSRSAQGNIPQQRFPIEKGPAHGNLPNNKKVLEKLANMLKQ